MEATLASIDSDRLISINPHRPCGPTMQHPSKEFSMRSTFRSMHNFAKVLVGPNRTKYAIHTKLLTASSPFFDAALNGRFTEAGDQTVTLPDERPEMFDWFVQWLYTGSLTVVGPSTCAPSETRLGSPRHCNSKHPMASEVAARPFTDLHNDGELRNSAGSPKYFLLIELYGLSDRLLTTSLSNHIIDTIARLSESTNSVPTPSDTWILYGDCCSFSGLHHCACGTNHRKSGGLNMIDQSHDEDNLPVEKDHRLKGRHVTRCPSLNPVNDQTRGAPVNEGIRPTAPLRDLILDLFTYKKTDRLLSTHRDDWHPLFLRDLVVRMKRPGREALTRHRMISFSPHRWSGARACEACRSVIGPTTHTTAEPDVEGDDGAGAGGAMITGGWPIRTTTRAARNQARIVATFNADHHRSRSTAQHHRHQQQVEVTSANFRPNSATQCLVCSKVYCAPCLREAFAPGRGLDAGDARFGLVGSDVGPCKPWLRWEVEPLLAEAEVLLPSQPGQAEERLAKRYSLGVCGRYHEHGWSGGGAGGFPGGPESEDE